MIATPYSIDLFWSFRSPYCYLALDRILALQVDTGAKVTPRHVWPGAMRKPGYFAGLNPNYPAYQAMDAQRCADYLGLPFARPKPDPLNLDRVTLEPSADQSLIENLSRMGVLATELGRGMDFIDQIMRLLWDGQTPGWNEGAHLTSAIDHAGLDGPELKARADLESERLDNIIRVNGDGLKDAGHWGVPCLVFEDEPFFGQDRIDILNWRIRAFTKPEF